MPTTSIHDIDQRHVIIHGHFYQPPRENPWLGFIERQASAAPFHDWTERVTEECYRANAFSPLLGRAGRTARLVNNFEYLSFNVGPTLMEWLEPHAPDVYQRIIHGDQGNAIAQGYNHAILPLCRPEDKRIQVLWGLEDFRRRFGREAEGIWLPETAIDQETVEVLIECGVRFTILAPSQLAATRPLEGGGDWEAVEAPGETAHYRPYRLFGRNREAGHLDVFFFHPTLSREISFGPLLRDGRALAKQLERSFDQQDPTAQALVLATDGETFGHHQAFGNMCLSWLFSQPAEKLGFRLTNFSRCLDLHPPEKEARLQPGPDGEGTAWSCAHGVGRWTRDCGCSTGAGEGWNQQWRTPLREALDRLRDLVAQVSETEGDNRDKELNELQHYSQKMFTSCGWFFNDISGLEPVQNLFYARRVVELLQKHFGRQAEAELLETLRRARSNVAGKGHGARIYRREVLPRTLQTTELVASARLLSTLGIEQPLGDHGEHRLETVALEQVRRGPLALEAGWSRLYSRLAPRPRPFLHLTLQTEDDGWNSWAEAVAEEKVENAFRHLLAALARQSAADILEKRPWLFNGERQLPPAFSEMIQTLLQQRQDRETARWMLELHGRGRRLIEWAAMNRDSGPAALALARLYRDRVAAALEQGGRTSHRPAMGMMRMIRSLDLPLDRSAAETVVDQALRRQLDHPDLFRSRAQVRLALQQARLAQRMAFDPAENLPLRIRFWVLLEQCLAAGGPVPEAIPSIVQLAGLLGFQRRTTERWIRN